MEKRRTRNLVRAAHLAFLLLFATGIVSSALSQKPNFPDILNFLWLGNQFCVGGQPAMADLARLKAAGVKSILNLRRRDEFPAAREERAARRLGLRYFSIPVNEDRPTDADAARFLKILANPRHRPIFIHCRTANRVGAFWMIRRVLVDGWRIDDARGEAKKIGMRGGALETFALGYIRRHQHNAVPLSTTLMAPAGSGNLR